MTGLLDDTEIIAYVREVHAKDPHWTCGLDAERIDEVLGYIDSLKALISRQQDDLKRADELAEFGATQHKKRLAEVRESAAKYGYLVGYADAEAGRPRNGEAVS